jgi:MFS family permease
MPPRVEETSIPGPLSNAPAGLDTEIHEKAGATTSSLSHRVIRRIAAALHHRDFRVLWFGACTSSIGTWMQSLAENWLVLTLTASAFYLGLDSFLQQAPILLFTLIGGVVADRYDRRRTLLTSQCVQMFSACMLALLLYTGVVQIWHILALSFLTGCAQSFGGPAYQALIPSIVGKADLTNAIALNSIQFNIARFIGPLLAGAALAMLGRWGLPEESAMSVIFGLNGVSFLVVIMALLSLRVTHVPGVRAHSLFQELRTGLGYVRHEKTVLGLLVLSGLATLLGFPLITLLPVFAKDIFGQGVEGYSTLMAFSGAGAIVGALVVAWLGKHGRMGRSTLLLMTAHGGLVILFAISRSVWLSHVLLFVAGTCQMIVFSTLISLVQLIAPNEMRGRIMSIYLVAFRGGMPLGSLVSGYLASLVPAPVVLSVTGSLLSMVGVGYLIKSRIRQL